MKPRGWRAAGLIAVVVAAAWTGTATARGTPGQFDYWLLALSWSPQYCADRASDMQCSRPYDFVVHGLWPQFERGFPDACIRNPGQVQKELITRMLPLMPSEDLIRHQWRKHGTCSGMEMQEYFLTVERARRAVVIPEIYRTPATYLRTTVREIEDEFLQVNPRLNRDTLAVQCRGRYLREVRVCFDKSFQPRQCGEDVDDRCGAEVVLRPNRTARGTPKSTP